MDCRLAFTLIICSSSLNCASCDRNCVPSAGFRGFWFLIWVTSSCRKVCLLTVGSLAGEPAGGGGAGAGLDVDANGLPMVAMSDCSFEDWTPARPPTQECARRAVAGPGNSAAGVNRFPIRRRCAAETSAAATGSLAPDPAPPTSYRPAATFPRDTRSAPAGPPGPTGLHAGRASAPHPACAPKHAARRLVHSDGLARSLDPGL